jgi:hypothetical protein
MPAMGVAIHGENLAHEGVVLAVAEIGASAP